MRANGYDKWLFDPRPNIGEGDFTQIVQAQFNDISLSTITN
jgi:hypothetical protein